MAIYTRFGSEVTIIAVNKMTNEVTEIVATRLEDESTVTGTITDFVADFGLSEIVKAIESLN